VDGSTVLKSPTETAQTIVDEDLDYVCRNLQQELARLAGKRLLITGGAGFLGYYLIQAILRQNAVAHLAPPIEVTVYDNYIRGMPPWLKDLAVSPHLTLVAHDITRPLPEPIGDFQYIIHAASIASPTYYRQHPIETMDANVNGLRHLLEYCRRQQNRGQPVEGFLFQSSSEIYGDPTPDNIPTSETYPGNVSCTGPRACYDESKRYGEALCVNFVRVYGLRITIARPFNNYGPGLKITDRRVLADLARDLFAGRDIVLLSDGSPTRTFCYIADAVVGYYKVLVRGRPGEAYNIGVSAPEISIADLAERVSALGRQLFGFQGRVTFAASGDTNYLIDNPRRRCPAIEKAKVALGYDPKIPLDEGLRRTLIWYAEHREAVEDR
jgi:nucleoside-diphosphate-sugar epimerase